jgi:hypothetical protein
MPKFLVSQSVDIDISYVVEAETLEDALTYGNFDVTKVVSVDHLNWDKPYDAEALADGTVLPFLTHQQLLVYMNAGIL